MKTPCGNCWNNYAEAGKRWCRSCTLEQQQKWLCKKCGNCNMCLTCFNNLQQFAEEAINKNNEAPKKKWYQIFS